MRTWRAARFRRAVAAALLAAGLTLVRCSPEGGASAPPPGAKPSVLLITLDTTRTDRLGCYGSPAKLTPFLDGLAPRSTLFERAYSAVPLTLPSHATILSGWLPLRHGVRVNGEAGVPREVPLLAEAFRLEGYATGAFVSASVLLRRYGLDRGFQVYDDSFYEPGRSEAQKATAETTLPKALAWIRKQRGPFFCWVHLFDPHRPYAGKEPYCSLYPDRPYDAEVAYMDDQLASFWKSLRASVDVDALAVAVCADHGEALGERGEEEHGILLYENTTRVPLLLRLPGQREARRVAAPVGLVDLAPTLRDLTGLPAVRPADGRSLLPLLRGRELAPKAILSESLAGMLTFGWAPLYALVDGSEKFIEAPRPELYDLAADPGETTDLSAQRRDRSAALRTALRAARAAVPAPRPASEPLDDEALKRLASLGYLGGMPATAPISGKNPREVVGLVQPIRSASDLVGQRRYAEAETAILAVLSRDPQNPYALLLLGQALRPRDPSRAVSAWKRAVELAPAFSLAWSEWVRLQMDEGLPDEAARVAELALASCADRTGMLHMALAYRAGRSGQGPERLLAEASAALEMNPDLAPAYLLRAEAHRRAGRESDARADVERALSLMGAAEPGWWRDDPVLGEVLRAFGPREPKGRRRRAAA